MVDQWADWLGELDASAARRTTDILSVDESDGLGHLNSEILNSVCDKRANG